MGSLRKRAKALPEEEPIELDDSSEEEGDVEQKGWDPEEPHGAQVLRRLHQDDSLLMPQYDEMMGPLEHEEIKGHLQKKLEEKAQHLDEIEDLWGKHYSHLPPIAGAKGLDEGGGEEVEETEEEEEVPDDLDDDAMGADSSEEDLPSGDEVAEGMQAKGFWRKVKSLRVKGRKRFRGLPVDAKLTNRGWIATVDGMPDNSGPAFIEKREALDYAKKHLKAFDEMDEADDNAEIPEEKGLMPHHVKHVQGAQGHLKDVSEADDLDREMQNKSYHWHKALEGVADEMEGKDLGGDVMGAVGMGALDDEDMEEKRHKKDKEEKDLDEDEEEKGWPEPKKPRGFKGLEAEEDYEEKDGLDIPDPLEGMPSEEPAPEGKGMHCKSIRNASHFLKDLSGQDNLTDDHKGEALMHHEALGKALDAAQQMEGADETAEVTEPGMEMGATGQMHLKALKWKYQKDRMRWSATDDQSAFVVIPAYSGNGWELKVNGNVVYTGDENVAKQKAEEYAKKSISSGNLKELKGVFKKQNRDMKQLARQINGLARKL